MLVPAGAVLGFNENGSKGDQLEVDLGMLVRDFGVGVVFWGRWWLLWPEFWEGYEEKKVWRGL